jgi:hypothetical protein
MNREDIILMAQKAGFQSHEAESKADEFEYFANLVATAEREACAKVCMDKWMEWMDASPDKRLDMRNDAEDCAFAIRNQAKGEK